MDYGQWWSAAKKCDGDSRAWFIHSHNSLCYHLSLRAAESGCDEAVVRFTHTAAEGDRGASFEVYERNSTRSGGAQIFTAKSCSPRPTRWLISRDAIA